MGATTHKRPTKEQREAMLSLFDIMKDCKPFMDSLRESLIAFANRKSIVDTSLYGEEDCLIKVKKPE